MTPSYEPASPEDLEQLVELRIEAMRESLTAVGRFEPQRARERFSSTFEPASTRHVVIDGARVGFLVVKETSDGLLLDHLYLRPSVQGRGLGSAVLQGVFADADARGLSIHVGALKNSAANRFYERHGFVRHSETEWDVYYRRDPLTAGLRSS
jgi:GNAT superfamily N-acetyltransferase